MRLGWLLGATTLATLSAGAPTTASPTARAVPAYDSPELLQANGPCIQHCRRDALTCARRCANTCGGDAECARDCGASCADYYATCLRTECRADPAQAPYPRAPRPDR